MARYESIVPPIAGVMSVPTRNQAAAGTFRPAIEATVHLGAELLENAKHEHSAQTDDAIVCPR